MIGVLAQRLVRTLCQACKEPYTALPELVDELGLARVRAPGRHHALPPERLQECAQTGYSGRISIIEMLPMSDPLRRLVLKHADLDGVAQRGDARGHGDDARGRPAQGAGGITTFEEVLRVTRES